MPVNQKAMKCSQCEKYLSTHNHPEFRHLICEKHPLPWMVYTVTDANIKADGFKYTRVWSDLLNPEVIDGELAGEGLWILMNLMDFVKQGRIGESADAQVWIWPRPGCRIRIPFPGMVDGNPQADVDLIQIRYGHTHNLDNRSARIDLLRRIELLWVPYIKQVMKEHVEEYKIVKDADWRDTLGKMRREDGQDTSVSIIKPSGTNNDGAMLDNPDHCNEGNNEPRIILANR